MVNDSVREELQTKVGISKKLPKPIQSPAPFAIEVAPVTIEAVEKITVAKPEPPALKPVAKPAPTVELNVQKTSPTLVGFQAKNPTVPDWRLQLQNAVRHRKTSSAEMSDAVGRSYEKQLVTNGANALKAEYVEAPKPAPKPEHDDPRVANALKRINQSRSTFLNEPAAKPVTRPGQASKNFPFNVVQRDLDVAIQNRIPTKATPNVPPKPRLVPTIVTKQKYDTNKLPPIAEPEVISSFDMEVTLAAPPPQAEEIREPETAPPVMITAPQAEVEESYVEEVESEEIEDLAPFSIRFNAGLFDFIIGTFLSLILLSPLAFFGGNWISFSGFLTFAATTSIVMFAYMTIALGLYGKTFGMRMFSLELIDAEENAYPTFHQAAVHSAAYLLSLPFFGIGFITVLFNEEKRAAHDLLSGTIIVVEF
jgi:uncharacterized RDD family membrane protein YckC